MADDRGRVVEEVLKDGPFGKLSHRDTPRNSCSTFLFRFVPRPTATTPFKVFAHSPPSK